jgi:hypothetical protein
MAAVGAVAAWLLRQHNGFQAGATYPVGEFSCEDLAEWADSHDLVLVNRAEYDALCARVAAGIVEMTDLDAEHRVLLGNA